MPHILPHFWLASFPHIFQKKSRYKPVSLSIGPAAYLSRSRSRNSKPSVRQPVSFSLNGQSLHASNTA